MNFKIMIQGAGQLISKRLAGPFWTRRCWLVKTQWLDKKQLEEIQLMLLRRLVRHSYNTVPFYKELMDERGIQWTDIKKLDDVKLFPILSKKTVLEAEHLIVSAKYPKWTLRATRTGGSTGTPLVIYRNWFSIGNEHAFVRRQWDWAGVSFFDKCAYLMSRVVAKPDQKCGLYAYDPVMRELILSTHHLSAETAKDYARVMRSYEVKAVVGYPSAIYFLAQTCLNSDIDLRLKATLTTSELLTPSMRDIITQAFHCKVFDFYGSAERVCYIQTCECGNYHIIPEYGLTELIPLEKSDGAQCKVVSTGFWNMAMPLIRYDTGDIVVKSENACPCGRQFPLIESINGREGDVIRTPSGRHLGVTLIIQLLYVICGTRSIAESRVIQDAIDHLSIEYVPLKKFDKKDLEDFKSLIVKYIPSELRFDFKKVEAIERTSSGKIRPLVSLINS